MVVLVIMLWLLLIFLNMEVVVLLLVTADEVWLPLIWWDARIDSCRNEDSIISCFVCVPAV